MRDLFDEKQKRILRKSRLLKRIARTFLGVIERRRRRFLTFHERPAYAAHIRVLPTARDYSAFAIVLQGPILHAFDFTLETIKLYRKYYTNVAIILSTWQWEDRDTRVIEEARKEGARVILNEKLDYFNLDKKFVNLNLQILSSRSGVEQARQLGARWALKTRTDQRMYNPAALDLCYGALESFPLSERGSIQRSRIIGLNRGKSRPKLYHLADWFIFGDIDDVSLYWAANVVTEVPSYPGTTRAMSAEAYLFTEFLKKVGTLCSGRSRIRSVPLPITASFSNSPCLTYTGVSMSIIVSIVF